jgi:APA family basic amino acid/polyamine antiporter
LIEIRPADIVRASMTQLFRRKPIAELVPEGEHALRRVLSAGDLIMLAIGAVIGAGIFGAIGTAAAGQIGPNGEVIRYGAGPALVFSFLLLGGACALAALCYAELAAMIPQAGSAYAYSYATMGELVAWVIGWDLILEYAVGNVAVAISWGDYFTTLLRGVGLQIPVWLTTGYRTALLSSNPDVHGLLGTAPQIAASHPRQCAGVCDRDGDYGAAAARREGGVRANNIMVVVKLAARAVHRRWRTHSTRRILRPSRRTVYGHPQCRRHRVLRLHWLRCDFDRRRRQRTRTGTFHRHIGWTGDLLASTSWLASC